MLESLEDRRLLVATISVSAEAPVAIPENPQDQIVYSIHRDETDGMLAVKFELTGDAIYNVDYLAEEVEQDTIWFPEDAAAIQPVTGTATFSPGQSTIELVVSPSTDAFIERDEDIVVTIVAADQFGPVVGAAALIVRHQDTQYHVVDEQNRLALVDIETGCVQVIGTITSSQPVADIAFTEDGDLYAITADDLYLVRPDEVSDALISTTFLGKHGIINANALIDSRDGDFDSEIGDLFAVGEDFLDLQLIDLEVVNQVLQINNVWTVFDIDVALESQQLPFDYRSSGDLDYVSSGHLILSAWRPGEDGDSLIEIRTPGNFGVIENSPKPAEDPDESFSGISGLAFDGNDSFAFSGYTMLSVNQFSRDSSRELELTGRPYLVGTMSTATGTIQGDPVTPPVVSLNSLRTEPLDLSQGTQPTTWSNQRSELRDIVIDLGAELTEIPLDGIVLTNLGVTGQEAPVEINLQSDQVTLEASGEQITILLGADQLPNGRYQLELSEEITGGPVFAMSGDSDNRFFVMAGDWDGNRIVDLLDLATFAYWFGNPVTVAPEYVDLNGSGVIDTGDFTAFENNFSEFIRLPDGANPTDPDLLDADDLERAFQSAINPLDVNGDRQVSPLDALNVINRLASGFADNTDWRYDVNRDGTITPRDALRVLNTLALESSTPQLLLDEQQPFEFDTFHSDPQRGSLDFVDRDRDWRLRLDLIESIDAVFSKSD